MKHKRLFTLLLCLLFVLPIVVGCSNTGDTETTAATEPAAPHVLSVGFGRADVTPSESVPLSGLFAERMSTGVNEPLYVNCIAFTDETGNTFLIISADFLYPYIPMIYAKSDIAKETGIPFNQIWVATTHNHSGPDCNREVPSIETYNKYLRTQIIAAAKAALEDRKPATAYITETRPERINFVRHYLLQDGTYGGDNFGGDFGSGDIVQHVTEADNQLQLIKFVREGGKDIVLMNWQGHPTGHSGAHRYKIMSCVTVALNKLEQGLDCHAAYILGASGNVNNSSRISGEAFSNDYVAHFEKLAEYAIDAASGFQQVQTAKIQALDQNCSCVTKAGVGSKDIPLSAFAIGDIAFVAAPYEMFDTNGMQIKDGSPFKMTFVSTCTNGYNSYIPSEGTYEYGGYEVNGTDLAAGGGENLANTFVSMLKQLHEAQ